jgi:hypothetical protein
MVAAVGSHAQRFKVGDQITTHAIPRWLRGQVLSPEDSPSLGLPLPGVLAEYVLLDEDGPVTPRGNRCRPADTASKIFVSAQRRPPPCIRLRRPRSANSRCVHHFCSMLGTGHFMA